MTTFVIAMYKCEQVTIENFHLRLTVNEFLKAVSSIIIKVVMSCIEIKKTETLGTIPQWL